MPPKAASRRTPFAGEGTQELLLGAWAKVSRGRFIVLELGELVGVQFENVVMHEKRSGNRSGTEDLVAGCFKQLDKGIVDQLFKFYQVDFDMFGYNPEKYFTYAKI